MALEGIELAKAYVSLIVSSDEVAPTTRKAMGAAEDEAAKAGTESGKKFGKGFNTAALAAVGVVVAKKAFGLIKESITNAGNLEQSIGGVDAVFKESSGRMHAWAKSAAKNVGLSKNAYNELSTVLGAGLKNAGFGLEEVGDRTNDLIVRAADLSAMYGGTASEAVEAVQSLLRGETNPIERYGISITAASIAQKAMAMTGKKATSELTAMEKSAAAQALLFAQSADASGKFASEADTLQGKLQRFQAASENLSTSLGNLLLPIVTSVMGVIQPIAQWLSENTVVAGILAGVIATVVVVAFYAWAASIWAANAALLANPATWIILGIIAAVAALVAGVIWLTQNWDLAKVGMLLAVNGMIHGANALIHALNGIARAMEWVLSLGTSSGNWGNIPTFDLIDVPGLAEGGTVTRSGTTLVGERGPELLRLPRGSQVIPLDHEAAQSGNGTTVNQTFINPIAERSSQSARKHRAELAATVSL